jgi:hypothetical protein
MQDKILDLEVGDQVIEFLFFFRWKLQYMYAMLEVAWISQLSIPNAT